MLKRLNIRAALTHFVFIKLQLIITLIISGGQVAAKVPAVIVFGDSTADAGNNNRISTIVKCNFEPYGRDLSDGRPTGRFSNGRLTSDFISEAFQIKPLIPAYLDPNFSIMDFATGVTFASSGSGYDNVTSKIANVIPLGKELELFKDYQKKLITFLGKKKAMETTRESVYVISMGTNDFILNYFLVPDRSTQFTIEEYKNFLIGIAERFILTLYGLGARKILLVGIPPMGCLPLIRTANLVSPGACNEVFNDVAKDFNRKLMDVTVKLRNKAQGIKLVFGGVYDLVQNAIQNPASYGFENVAEGCCGTGTVELAYLCDTSSPLTCPDASKYVFWDAVHATETLYSRAADHLMKAIVPEFL